MSDGKIHIPARRKQPVGDQMVVKVTPEAYNALVDIYNESTLSLKQIARDFPGRDGESSTTKRTKTIWHATMQILSVSILNELQKLALESK